MTGMLVETVVVSFCVGGAVGAAVAMQLLLHIPKKTEAPLDREN